jgi:hypothetical protein
MGFLDLSVKDASSGLILGFLGGMAITFALMSTKSVSFGKQARAYEGVTTGPPAMHYGSYGGLWDLNLPADENEDVTYNHTPFIGATASTDFNPENMQFSEAYNRAPGEYTPYPARDLAHFGA